MSNFVALLNALWPYALVVAVLIGLTMFRREIGGLLPRLKHAKFLGKTEVEFESVEAELQAFSDKEIQLAAEVSRALKQLPSPTSEAVTENNSAPGGYLNWQQRQDLTHELMALAAAAPDVAVVRVGYAVNQAATLILAAIGAPFAYELPGATRGMAIRLPLHQPDSIIRGSANAASGFLDFNTETIKLSRDIRDGDHARLRSLQLQNVQLGQRLRNNLHALAFRIASSPEFKAGLHIDPAKF
jgi:hypothetical protein